MTDIQTLLRSAVQFMSRGQPAAAEAGASRAVALAPDNGPILHLFGVISGLKGDHHGAVNWLFRALVLGRGDDAVPTLVAALQNRGTGRHSAGRMWAAASDFRTAMALDPGNVDCCNNLSAVCRSIGEPDAALDLSRRALYLDPARADLMANYAVLIKDRGHAFEAVELLRRASRLRPDDAGISRRLLSAVTYCPDMDPQEAFAEHLHFAARHVPPGPADIRFGNTRDPDRRLAIGILSSDLKSHPVAGNLVPIIAERDRRQTAIHLYSLTPQVDATSERLRAMADGWRDVTGLADAEIAATIRADAIDLLIIVAGRFDENRLLVAAHRAAPVQISHYDAATSGLAAMDYILTDRVMTPRNGSERFTERPVAMPTLPAFERIADAPDPGPAPCRADGFPTLASLNNPCKLNDEVLALWGRVLAAIPEARMVFKYGHAFASPTLRRRIVNAFADYGVAAERIAFVGHRMARDEHLAFFRTIDVALDPFPFSGASTTFETLWMGVPVVTLPGTTMISRWSATLLHAIGAFDMVAASSDAYITTVNTLCRDPERLSLLRGSLRARLSASLVCDGRRQARHFERVTRVMWRRWLAATHRPGMPG